VYNDQSVSYLYLTGASLAIVYNHQSVSYLYLTGASLAIVYNDQSVSYLYVTGASLAIVYNDQSVSYLYVTGASLAIVYNDQSVLENFHVATAFKYLQTPGVNIFESLSYLQYKRVRRLVISMVTMGYLLMAVYLFISIVC